MHNNKTSQALLRIIDKICFVLPYFFICLIILGFSGVDVGILTLICAIIHELGHVFAAAMLGEKSRLSARLNGFRLYSSKQLSYKGTVAVALGGPLVNIIPFLLCAPFGSHFTSYVSLFGLINLFTAISNLLPIEGYDGYRIIHSALSIFLSPSVTEAIMLRVSMLLSAALMFISLYLMAKLGGGFWLYFVFLGGTIKAISHLGTPIFEKTRVNRRKKEEKRALMQFQPR